MAAFDGITQAQVTSSAVARLQALRRALQDCQDENAWLAGLSVTDLGAIGFSSTAASDLKSAFADAGALYQLFGRADPQTDGTLPATYTLPYVFGAAARRVIGPS